MNSFLKKFLTPIKVISNNHYNMNIIRKLKSLSISRPYLKQELDALFFKYKADQMTCCALSSQEKGVSDIKYCDHNIVVSLTTYGARLNEVYLAIESIMQGTWKPNKIILWLQEDLADIQLPTLLTNQVKRGLEIGYCKDIRSYKKLIPSLQKYPDDAIITIDDDVIYREDFVENLVKTHINNRDFICANYIERVTKDNGRVQPYKKWPTLKIVNEVSNLNMGIGVGGVLYPPHSLSNEVFNESVFTSICPFADDVWFYSMGVINGRKTIKSFTHNHNGLDYYANDNYHGESLSILNNVVNNGSGYDNQIAAVFEKYNIYKFIN